MGRFYIQWYRDKGRGQEAADAAGAEQLTEYSFPVARLWFTSQAAYDTKWWELLRTFQVNALTVYPLDYVFKSENVS